MSSNPPTSHDGPDLRLRPATADDARMLFSLRNDPAIVRLGRSKQTVTWAEHLSWFTRALSDEQRRRIFFLVENDETIGVLRFDKEDEPTEAVVSIYLLEPFRGQGRGPRALALGCAEIFRTWPMLAAVDAIIIADNERSVRAFQLAGFAFAGDEPDGSRRYRLERTASIREAT